MRRATLAAVLLLAISVPASAQDTVFIITPDGPEREQVRTGGIPPEVIREILATYNRQGTTRLWGDVDLPAGARLTGSIGVHRGSVAVSGVVEGDLLVVNGSLLVRSGGAVNGDVLLVGGRVTVREGGTISGTTRQYSEAAPIVRAPDGRLVVRERRDLPDLTTARTTFRSGSLNTTLTLGTDHTYNRVEGLPIIFGPTFELQAAPETTVRLDLWGILRTADDQSDLREDFGYRGRLELRRGKERRAGIGIRAYQQVASFHDVVLGRSENGWSAFLLQRDYRDWYLQRGVQGYLFGYPTPTLRLETSVRYDKETSLRANDPWSLFRNSDRWRANPLIDDGHYLTATAGFELDTRNFRDTPTSGWWIKGEFARSWNDDVAPLSLPPTVRTGLPTDGSYAFNTATLDVRRYSRLTPDIRMQARLYADGYAGGDPLPVQRRVGLGGPDPLPGFKFRSTTCSPSSDGDPSLAGLCDRVMYAQLEVRHRLNLDLGYQYRDSELASLDRFIGIDEADLVIFADAGKAWLSGDGPGQVPDNRIPNFGEWDADVGAGIDAGGIGAYLAKALTGDEPVRIIVRLQRRF